MESRPGASCLSLKFSSSKGPGPYIEVTPVPSLLTKSPPWIMKSLMTRWKVTPLYPCGIPFLLCSPVQNWRKFSAVFGQTSREKGRRLVLAPRLLKLILLHIITERPPLCVRGKIQSNLDLRILRRVFFLAAWSPRRRRRTRLDCEGAAKTQRSANARF